MGKVRKPQQPRSQKTVEAIVQAGFLVIQKQGIGSLSTRAVAERAGVGVGSVYEYFADKQAILDAMYRKMVEDLLQIIRPRMAELVKLQPRELVLRLLHDFRTFLQNNDRRYASYMSVVKTTSAEGGTQEINDALSELVVQYLMRHPELSRVPKLQIFTYITLHGGVAVVAQHVSEPNPLITFEELSEGLGDMVQNFLEMASH